MSLYQEDSNALPEGIFDRAYIFALCVVTF